MFVAREELVWDLSSAKYVFQVSTQHPGPDAVRLADWLNSDESIRALMALPQSDETLKELNDLIDHNGSFTNVTRNATHSCFELPAEAHCFSFCRRESAPKGRSEATATLFLLAAQGSGLVAALLGDRRKLFISAFFFRKGVSEQFGYF